MKSFHCVDNCICAGDAECRHHVVAADMLRLVTILCSSLFLFFYFSTEIFAENKRHRFKTLTQCAERAVDYFVGDLIDAQKYSCFYYYSPIPPEKQPTGQRASQLSNSGDAKTLQRGSLLTAVACSAASPESADTWERSTHCTIVVNAVSNADRVSSLKKIQNQC